METEEEEVWAEEEEHHLASERERERPNELLEGKEQVFQVPR